jgi:predicted RNA-binding protein Jag
MVIPMETWDIVIKNLLSGMGFSDYRLEITEDGNHNSLFIYESEDLVRENLPVLVEALNHLLQMIARKNGAKPIFIDINNYRQERESLIAELAKAAAKKVIATKQDVPLPAMNSYERRIVHVELAVHPDVTTESVGAGKERYIVIKPVKQN